MDDQTSQLIKIQSKTPVWSQYDVNPPSMCVAMALGMALKGSNVDCDQLTPQEIVEKALSIGVTHPIEGGISAAGCVRLAEEYALPEFIAFGPDALATNTQAHLRSLLRRGSPVIVMGTVGLNPLATGHAMVITHIDEHNRVTIHDSFSSFVDRKPPQLEGGLGEPLFKAQPGTYTCTWDEFDKCWNTIDNYITVPDEQWDTEGRIAPLYEHNQWVRFCCAVFPKKLL